MIHANILIVTLSDTDALTSTVQDVLASASNITVKLLPRKNKIQHEPPADIFEKVDMEQVDVALIVPARSGLFQCKQAISGLKSRKAEMPVMIVDDIDGPEEIIEYFRMGVTDYIAPPFRSVDILPRVWRQVEYSRERKSLVHKLKQHLGLKQLVGSSPAFLEVVNKVPIVAQSDFSVLITGETGTGKEMCARAIHYLGPRAGKPFVPVNCGAIPPELAENELFGHVKGAFTGANDSANGIFNESEGGTVFLDEIDSLTLQLQVKILRFLQEKEYRPVGSSKMRKADVRIVAATNADLEKAVEERTFRQDLYYRLNIIHLELPPLRERAGDIPLLARHFLTETADELGRTITDFAPQATQKLASHCWPGNVRELENVIKRAVIFAKGNEIQADEIDLPNTVYPIQTESFQAEKARVVAEFENRYMHLILQANQGNITKAANACGKNRRAFFELMRKYNIDADKYKPSSQATG